MKVMLRPDILNLVAESLHRVVVEPSECVECYVQAVIDDLGVRLPEEFRFIDVLDEYLVHVEEGG